MLTRQTRKTICVAAVTAWIGFMLLYLTLTEVSTVPKAAGKTTWRSRDRRQYDSQSGSPELTDLIAKEARFLWTDRKRPSSEEKDRTSYGIDILPNEIRTNNGQRPKPVSGPGKDKNVNQETYNKIVEKVSKDVVPRKTSEDVFAERRRHLHDVCSQDPEAQQGGVKGIFKHQKSGVIYCFVPKAGCTFWKRVFHVVNQDKPGDYDVFNISRHSIHAASGNGAAFKKLEHNSTMFPTRFTVARDPFSRLLSSYLDKAYLPDFWGAEMLPIVHRLKRNNETSSMDFMRSHFDNMAAQFDPNFNTSSTSQDVSCGKYVTFAEFVKGGYGRLEPHWMPLSQICNPCKFNVTHLSYMETFTQDARAILDRLGLEGLLDDLDKDSQVDEELRMIVDYNFRKLQSRGHVTRCASPQEIAYRLWNNFRWRGYIDPDVDYVPPSQTRMKIVKDDLESQLAVARKSGLRDRAKLKAAKEDFTRRIYLTLSKDLFEKVLRKYRLDFKFYGYEGVRDRLAALIEKQECDTE